MQASSGAAEAGAGGGGGDAEDGGDAGGVQTVPAGEQQHFAAVLAEVGEGVQQVGLLDGLLGAVGSGHLVQALHLFGQALLPGATTAVIGERVARRPQEPGHRVDRQAVEVPPGGEVGLGDDVVAVGVAASAADVAVDARRRAFVEPPEVVL